MAAPVQPIQTTEIISEPVRTIVSWRAILAGTFITLLTYFMLTALGLAIGGAAVQDVIRGEGATGFGWGSAAWLIFTGLFSLFVGSYCAARVSGLITGRVGRIQGAVVAALFFALMLSQIGATLGFLGRGVGSMIGAAGGAAGDLSQNPRVQETLDQALGGLNLKAPPEEVAQGLAIRLFRGDGTAARNYLAQQAGISPAEADRRLETLKQNMEQTLNEVGATAARVTSIVGWTLFGSLFLGTLFAMLGGGLGASANLKTPLSRSDEKAIRKQRAA